MVAEKLVSRRPQWAHVARRVVGLVMLPGLLIMGVAPSSAMGATPRQSQDSGGGTRRSVALRGSPSHNSFLAINNKAMPGLNPTNWSTLGFAGIPPHPKDAANVGSNDLKYTVTFFDFPSSAAAATFYAAPMVAMLNFLRGAQGYLSLQGSTGVSGRSRGLDLRSCVGEGSGIVLYPSGQCSNGTPSFSIGVGTITQIGPVVLMVGYVRDNDHTRFAKSSELARTTRITQSGVQLLHGIGVRSS
jgi:hypothetical protein